MAMAACWWVLALAAAALAESDPQLLRLGERALCTAAHSRFARLQPRTPSRAFPRLTGTTKPSGYNVFLVFGVRPCSGVLLSESHVITSLYCVGHYANGTAFLGGLKYQSVKDLQQPEVKIAYVVEFRKFQEVDKYLDHDVIIVKLHRRFEQDKRISYAELTDITSWESVRPGVFMGFGETFEGDSVHELRSGDVLLDCGAACSPFVDTYSLGENALCGNSSYYMCWGDMGGAVVDLTNGMLVGLVTYKTMRTPTFRMCSEPPIHTFFMFIGYYREWIQSVISPAAIEED